MAVEVSPIKSLCVTALLILLCLAAGVMTWKWRQAETELVLARQEATSLRDLQEFFVVELPDVADPYDLADRNVKLQTVLERNAREIRKRFRDHPVVEAESRFQIGRSFYRIGLYDAGLEQFEKSLKIRERQLGAEHHDTLQALLRVANAKHQLGDHKDAIEIFDRIIEFYKSGHNPETANLLDALMMKAGALVELNRLDEAEDAAREYLNASFNDVDLDSNRGMEQLAKVHFAKQQYEECEKVIRQRLSVSGSARQKINASNILAKSQMARGDSKSASKTLSKLLETLEAEFGTEHDLTLECATNFALALSESGEFGQARDVLGIYLQISLRVHGESDQRTVSLQELNDELPKKVEQN